MEIHRLKSVLLKEKARLDFEPGFFVSFVRFD